ncbi:DnaJ C-terminal domain-containing protein [Gudongella sp. DL1XJH-153]|uniref:DnaJ C-terminal domain-containing protein n=1 Tax=Gudongella sp. DL1XJH-153 TaxID=3409804 RepID=UPI003BB65C74
MEYKDYYKILEVDKSASQDEIKKSYRKLAKKYHPDLHPNDDIAQEKFKEVNEAYEVLGDENKRKQFDQIGQYGFSNGQQFDPSQFGFGNFGGGTQYTYTSDDGTDFSDFFNLIFGGAGGRGGFDMGDMFGARSSAGSRRAPRQSYESELTISIEEAYNGVSREVSLNMGGVTKKMTVKVPKGITSGKKIKVKGDKWGIDGDILFKINIKESKDMRLEGLDIIKRVPVLPWEAALGEKVVVQTLSGKIKVDIPEGLTSGTRMRLPGKGFVDLKKNKGDLYIELLIVNPPELSEKEKKLYKKLKEEVKYNPRKE